MRFDRHDLIYRLRQTLFFSIFFVRRRRRRRRCRRRRRRRRRPINKPQEAVEDLFLAGENRRRYHG